MSPVRTRARKKLDESIFFQDLKLIWYDQKGFYYQSSITKLVSK
jgi:hypothetical protein